MLIAGNTVFGALGIRSISGKLFSGGVSLVNQYTDKLRLGAEITAVASGNFQLSKGQLQTTLGGGYHLNKKLTFDFGSLQDAFRQARGSGRCSVSLTTSDAGEFTLRRDLKMSFARPRPIPFFGTPEAGFVQLSPRSCSFSFCSSMCSLCLLWRPQKLSCRSQTGRSPNPRFLYRFNPHLFGCSLGREKATRGTHRRLVVPAGKDDSRRQ